MSVIPSSIGFDEGGVMQALAQRPIWKRVTHEYEYNKKGLLDWEQETTLDVSLLDVIIPLVLGGFITLTPLFMQAIKDAGGGAGKALDLNTYIALYGPILGPILYYARSGSKT